MANYARQCDLMREHGYQVQTISSNHVKIRKSNGANCINFYPSTGSFNPDGEKSAGRGINELMDYLGVEDPNGLDIPEISINSKMRTIEDQQRIEAKAKENHTSQHVGHAHLNFKSQPLLRLKYKRLDKDAFPPRKTRVTDAGIDLHALEEATWHQHGNQWFTVIKTGIALEIPPGFYLATAPRSSSLFGEKVSTFHSVLDTGYKGEVTFLCHSFSETRPNPIKRGDRAAQVVLVPVPLVDTSFDEVAELPDHSDRNHLGFGSSGDTINKFIEEEDDTPWEK